MRRAAAMLLIALVHLVAQLGAWATHPGNRPPGADAESARVTFEILSFPLLYLPEPWTTAWFFPLAILNSVAWAGALLMGWVLIGRLRRSKFARPQ